MFSTQWRNKITLRKKNLGIYLNCIIKMTMYFWNICLYFGGRNKSIHFKSTVRISVKSPPCALQTIPLWVYTDNGGGEKLHPALFRWASTPGTHFSSKSVSGYKGQRGGAVLPTAASLSPHLGGQGLQHFTLLELTGPQTLAPAELASTVPTSLQEYQLHCGRSYTVSISSPCCLQHTAWTISVSPLS